MPYAYSTLNALLQRNYYLSNLVGAQFKNASLRVEFNTLLYIPLFKPFHILFIVGFASRNKIFKFYEVTVNLNMQYEEDPLTPNLYSVNAIKSFYLSAIAYFFNRLGINHIVDCLYNIMMNFAGKFVKSLGKIF